MGRVEIWLKEIVANILISTLVGEINSAWVFSFFSTNVNFIFMIFPILCMLFFKFFFVFLIITYVII